VQKLTAYQGMALFNSAVCALRPGGLPLQDPYALQQYMDSNIFLPDINNEKQHKSQHYVENMATLDQLVLYRFANDTTGRGRAVQSRPAGCSAAGMVGQGLVSWHKVDHIMDLQLLHHPQGMCTCEWLSMQHGAVHEL
jgi:hypothetical protein